MMIVERQPSGLWLAYRRKNPGICGMAQSVVSAITELWMLESLQQSVSPKWPVIDRPAE